MITTTVSVSQKVNLGNYESADVFISLQGVEVDTPVEDIEVALDTTKVVYDAIRRRVIAEATALRTKPTPIAAGRRA